LTRALVLGGAGFIGVAACKELMRRGVETIAAGRKERPYGTFTSYVAFDRTDEDQLVRALAQTQPDVLLDLACYQPGEVDAVPQPGRPAPRHQPAPHGPLEVLVALEQLVVGDQIRRA